MPLSSSQTDSVPWPVAPGPRRALLKTVSPFALKAGATFSGPRKNMPSPACGAGSPARLTSRSSPDASDQMAVAVSGVTPGPVRMFRMLTSPSLLTRIVPGP